MALSHLRRYQHPAGPRFFLFYDAWQEQESLALTALLVLLSVFLLLDCCGPHLHSQTPPHAAG